ncbi:hypothetical protein, partial [Treponema endosymbiont of Eucomonympha sp.]|uniref:hypothetical protein n=1 Tax=Treponema endosymbiont of Eucomonympha sp. TaxID=1580831 RepID=UPI001E49F45C
MPVNAFIFFHASYFTSFPFFSPHCLDRIHADRKILTCYDFSATPFAPSGKKNDTEALFSWIVTDFGLNDGIESGLVKTPRVVVRDDGTPDAKTFRSKLYPLNTAASVKDEI